MTAPAPTTLRPVVPVDYPGLVAKLKLRGSCVITEYRGSDPAPVRVTRPATCADGALTIVLTETVGPYTDSSPRPILTLTHRASGLAVDVLPDCGRWWLTTAAGLRHARRVLRAVLTSTKGAVDWSAVDPLPTDPEARELAAAAMRASVAAVLEPAEQKA